MVMKTIQTERDLDELPADARALVTTAPILCHAGLLFARLGP